MRQGSNGRPSGLMLLMIVGMLALATLPQPSSSEAHFATGPGLDWYYPEAYGMFLNGTEGDEGLDRTLPANTGLPPGEIIFLGTSLVTNLLSATSNAASETAFLSGNISVRLYAGLEVPSTVCRSSGIPLSPVNGKTTFYATVRVGDTVVMDAEPSAEIALEEDWNAAHEFLIRAPINTTLDEGERITLDIAVRHSCQADTQGGRLYWGTYDLGSGLQIEAEMLTPSLNVSVDANGAAHIEFTPHSPFGKADYDNVKIDVIGPLDTWEQGVHYTMEPDEEIFVEHLELPAHGSRQTETGRIAWTWAMNTSLNPGMYVIDLCAVTTDGLYTEPCHLVGVLRFEVESESSAWLGAGWFAVVPIISTLGLLGWLAQTRVPPWPALVVLGLLMVASMGAITTLPDIGEGEQRDETAAPDFALLTHGGGQAELGDLLDGKRALVLGVFTAGSPSADRQMIDFMQARDDLGDSVAFAQLITGDSVEMYDGDAHASLLNRSLMNQSWPLMIDERDGGVAAQLPTGIADGVVVIDAAGFVVAWHPSSMSPVNIEKAVETAESGGGRNPFEMLSLASLVVLLPLLVLGLPRERIDAPEEVLIPAAGWLGTAGAAAFGYLIWALPVAVIGVLGASVWSLAQIALIGWLMWQAIAMIIWQRIPEVDLLSGLIYNRLPESYRAWRSKDMWQWDTRMGHWLAWLSWIAMPTLLAQGVGARIAGGGLGLLTGPLMLLAFVILAGLLTLLFRMVAAIGGPISRLGGNLTRPVMMRSWGVLSAGLAVWLMVWFLLGPFAG